MVFYYLEIFSTSSLKFLFELLHYLLNTHTHTFSVYLVEESINILAVQIISDNFAQVSLFIILHQ